MATREAQPRVGRLLRATLFLFSVGMHGDAVAVVVRDLISWMGGSPWWDCQTRPSLRAGNEKFGHLTKFFLRVGALNNGKFDVSAVVFVSIFPVANLYF